MTLPLKVYLKSTVLTRIVVKLFSYMYFTYKWKMYFTYTCEFALRRHSDQGVVTKFTNYLLKNNFTILKYTSIISKLLESLVRDEFFKHLTSNNLLDSAQHGFVPNRSCVSNLLEILDFISASLADGFQCR